MFGLKSILSIALFAAAALADVAFTSTPTNVQVGQQYTLTWSGEDSGQPVTITLRAGNPGNLQTVATISTTASGGSYTWTPDSSLPDGGDYAFMIQQGSGTPNYSGQFSISGGTAASASASQASIISSQAASASSVAASQMSSASAAMSSATASSSSSSASSTGSSSSMSTSTKASSTSSASRTATSSSSTGAPSSNAGNFVVSDLQSPVALVLGAVAAIAAL